VWCSSSAEHGVPRASVSCALGRGCRLVLALAAAGLPVANVAECRRSPPPPPPPRALGRGVHLDHVRTKVPPGRSRHTRGRCGRAGGRAVGSVDTPSRGVAPRSLAGAARPGEQVAGRTVPEVSAVRERRTTGLLPTTLLKGLSVGTSVERGHPDYASRDSLAGREPPRKPVPGGAERPTSAGRRRTMGCRPKLTRRPAPSCSPRSSP